MNDKTIPTEDTETTKPKVCCRCGDLKETSEFYKEARNSDGFFSWCRQCVSTYRSETHRAHPERLKRIRYGIDFNELWAKQHGVCAVCDTLMLPRGQGPTSVVVDHDHNCCPGPKSCGKCVRGLVHKRCNMVLGAAADDTQILENAARYLNRWREGLT